MQRYVKSVASALMFLFVAACVTTTTASLTPVEPTNEMLKGAWVGTQYAKGQSWQINVVFKSKSAKYHVNADRAYRWESAVDINNAGDIVAQSPKRVDTYTLYKDKKDGSLRLKGHYTYNGQPWGEVDMVKTETLQVSAN